MQERAPLGELLLGIIDRPGRTLANVLAYPRWRWLAPAVLAIVALALFLIVSAPFLAAQSQQAMAQQLSRMPADQAEQVRAQMATFQSPVFVAGIGLLTGLIALSAGWVVQATVLYFASLMAGGELEFKPLLAVVPWLHVPFALESLLQGAFVAARGQLVVNQGLSYLVSSGNQLQDARNLAYVALGQVTLFRLWHLLLVYLLFREAGRFSRSAAFGLTLAYQAVVLGGQLAIAAVGRLLAPG